VIVAATMVFAGGFLHVVEEKISLTRSLLFVATKLNRATKNKQ
jgi:hypothetical protein